MVVMYGSFIGDLSMSYSRANSTFDYGRNRLN